MANERMRADAAQVLEGLDEQLRGIAEVQRQRADLTATITACEKRIKVTVNADGLLIHTEFAEDILDLTPDEIAENITAAVQAASAEVMRLGRELMRPLMERRTRLPKLSEMIEGAPDLGEMIPVAPPPKASLDDPERPRNDSPGTGFDTGARSMIADQDW
ncbi:DNA-binding protein YbaB [Nocardia transvalensis]|uniref:DNA-binding protein YbaB n=1 Tax=Nocardia transvalensis TaxID=37333 RepID=A0A7W9ULC3_9NOCA|nr:YbaB/EbfC family nucleoid-associated protein [Nocardia transvalensis]MBB5917401.1 DNA-binding protein YbaB [Nocardia transvalensis]